MKKVLLFLFIIIAAISVQATTVTATVTAYNKAELSGAVTDGMWVSFENSYKSKGQVRKGDVATLVISGWERCDISLVSVRVRSNKTSGAGNLTVSIAEEVLLSRSGEFSKWEGSIGYSTDYQTFTSTGEWSMNSGGTLVVTIEGTANSLHLDGIDIAYDLPMAEAHCVHFQWYGKEGEEYATICESSTDAGIVLPTLQSEGCFTVGDWQLIGWAQQAVSGVYATRPYCEPLKGRFYPKEETTLYPVYQQQNALQLIEHSYERESGEYAIVCPWGEDNYYMLQGDANGKGYITSATCMIEAGDEGERYLVTTSLQPACRYRLIFEGNKVSISNVESGISLGYSASALNTSDKQWEVAECQNGTLMLVSAWESEEIAQCLFFNMVKSDGTWQDVFALRSLSNFVNGERLMLFEVSDLPYTEKELAYCSNPFNPSALEEEKANETIKAVKVFDGKQIIILRGGERWDMMGRGLNVTY